MSNKRSQLFNYLYKRAHGGSTFWVLIFNIYTNYVLGCDIKPQMIIGEGFEIFHSARSTVIGPGTIIGNNVSVRQNTTIGSKGFTGSESSPIIGNNVTIGPNVCIIGNVHVNDGAVIGAGAVVVKDVEANAVVAGNPAKVLNFVNGGGKNWLKSLIRESKFYQWKKNRDDKHLAALRSPYLPALKNILGNDTSIISSNCIAGRIMQDLGMRYNTPTLGLYIWYPDYIELLRSLKYYMTEAKLTFVEHSKYPLGDERRAKWKHWYPIGLLDGKVEIQFLHYHSEQEAAEKWYRRAQRVNWDKLLIIGMEQNLCTEADIRAFDTLPFERKVFFSTKNMPELKSNVFVQEFEGMDSVGDPYKCGHVFYRYLIEKLK